MKKHLNKVLALSMAIAMVASMTACTSKNSSTSTGGEADGTGVSPEKMFNVVMTSNYTGFDPLRTNDVVSTYVTSQVYETLYQIKNDGEIAPLLADGAPEFSEDGMSATIKVKQGVKFHDGTPFNAEAVKYTFDLIKNPDFGSARASLASSIDTMEIIDEHTIKFNLKYEDGVLLAKLAHTNSAIVSPTAQAAQDLMINPCGTGPYKFVSAVSGSNVVLTRFDEYWGEKVEIKDITMTVIAEESTALARMETGEADFMPTLAVENISRVEAMKNVSLGTSDSAQIYYLALRPNSYINPLMANAEFRKAIAMAVNTEGYVEHVVDGHGKQAKSLIGPNVLGYSEAAESHYIPYDPAGAKAIIEKNGWADEQITFLLPTSPVYTPMGEYFQSNLKEAGFNNVKLEPIDWSAWLTESKAENRYDMTIAAWSNVTRDGTELLEPNWESKVSARTKVNSAELDALIEKSKKTSVIEERMASLEAANIMLLENAWAVPVFNNEQRYVYSNAYEGLCLDTTGVFYVSGFKVKK